MDDATASDNCGEVTIEVSSETTGDAAGNYVIVRTFTATDDAGNSASATQTITVKTPRPEFTFVLPTHRRVLGRDADGRRHGVDNCGRSPSRWTPPRRCRRQLRDRSHLHRHRRCWKQPSAADHHREDTTAPEFTFVPADYRRVLDEMPMDDATASDNCGEVTIEVSSETTRACRGQLRDRSHLHRHRRCWKQPSARRPSRRGHHSAGVHLRPADYTVNARTRCRWTTPRRRQLREVTIEVSETTAGDAPATT